MPTPISNLRATWANTSNVFVGIGMNVNAISYAANTKLVDFKINSNSMFSITPQGSTAMGARGQIPIQQPSQAAVLDLWARDKGLLFPRMTTTERDAIPNPPDGLVIYNEETDFLQIRRAGMWTNVGDVGLPGALPSLSRTLFVSTTGSDTANDGTSEYSPFASLEKALAVATARNDIVLIKVSPGVYYTQGWLDLPDGCIVQATHRSVFIRPVPNFEERNVFRMGSGCFVEGFIIENFRLNSLTDPTEGFAFSFRPGAVITRVPYAHKCAVRCSQPVSVVGGKLDPLNGNPQYPRGPGVVIADGLVCSQYSIFPNIMTWGATPVTYNGIGYCAKNGGLINAVNAISMWAHKHFLAMSGGQIILSSCSTQFGDYSLVASGSRNIGVPYAISGTMTPNTTAANAVAAASTTIINNMWTALTATGTISAWDAYDQEYTRYDGSVWIKALEEMLRGGGSDMIERFQLVLFDAVGNPVLSSDKKTQFKFCYDYIRDQINALTGVDATSQTMVNNATIAVKSTIDSPQTRTEPSRIEAIGHTWTANMIGVWQIKIPPAQSRLPIRDSILEQDGALVIATGQDSDGNAIFAGDVTIDARFGMGGRGFIAPTKREATRAAITFGGF
jgi:hypothetical protein